MKVQSEILTYQITSLVSNYMGALELNPEEIIDRTSVEILERIQAVFLQADIVTEDFLLVEQIIDIFHDFGLDTGVCHDF